MIRAVMDTNVLVAGLRSRLGASHQLLQLLRSGRWTLVLSNTVGSEYHEILHREAAALRMNHSDVDAFLDALCGFAERQNLSTTWTPAATDPDDEALVQLAREAKVQYLITHNVRHMRAAEQFGVRVLTPAEFLNLVRSTL
jgi:putative PIN family toxin of toxin-antitoxin system